MLLRFSPEKCPPVSQAGIFSSPARAVYNPGHARFPTDCGTMTMEKNRQ